MRQILVVKITRDEVDVPASRRARLHLEDHALVGVRSAYFLGAELNERVFFPESLGHRL